MDRFCLYLMKDFYAHSSAIIDENCKIGAGTKIGPHVVVTGHTRIGKNNQIFQFCSIGEVPQDKKYAGEPTRLEIGDNNVIRESCTFNIGTVQDVGVTRMGNNNWIMAYVHVAHDCQIGNNVIFANSTQLAGHVIIDDFVILGGFTGVHQFCQIGAHVMTAVGTVLLHDIPPYVKVSGSPAEPHGLNSEGLKRRGFTSSALAGLKKAYKTLYRTGLTLEEAKIQITQQIAECPEVQIMADFLNRTQRGIVR